MKIGDYSVIDDLISRTLGFEIPFSPACRQLIGFALDLLSTKINRQDNLSTTPILIAAVEWGRMPRDAFNAPPGILAELARKILGNEENADELYLEFLTEYFDAPPTQPSTEPPDFEIKFEITKNLARVLELTLEQKNIEQTAGLGAVQSDTEITIADLMGTLFDYASSEAYQGRGFIDRVIEFGSNIQDLASFTRSYIELNPAEEAPVWLCQYRTARNLGLEARMLPGAIEPWRLGKLPQSGRDRLRPGQRVILWRTIKEGATEPRSPQRGGIVGLGLIHDTDNKSEDQIQITIERSFPEAPISRDDIIPRLERAIPDERSRLTWPGEISIKQLSFAEQFVLNEIISGRQPKIAAVNQSSDQPETKKDFLRRAPLAFNLAHQINSLMDASKRSPSEGEIEDTFILHIDAPWGGGKTTFANYIARILNPSAFNLNLGNEKRDPDSIFSQIEMEDENYWPDRFKRRKWLIVEYNAWRNQHVSPPWWNFFDTVRRQANAQLSFAERSYYRFFEWLWRVFTPDVWKTIGILAMGGLVAGLLLRSCDNGNCLNHLDDNLYATLSAIGLAGGSIVAIVKSFQSGLKKVINSASQSIDPAALGQSDPLTRFRRHYKQTVSRYGKNRPILVIVDDLDRCRPGFVVEFVRGLLTIFRSPSVVFVLLGDRAWIEQSFEIVHADMNTSFDNRNRSFGSKFAEKAIQVSYLLPEPSKSTKEQYLRRVLSKPLKNAQPQHIESEDAPTAQTNEVQRTIRSKTLSDYDRRTRERFRTLEDLSKLENAISAARVDAVRTFGAASEPVESWTEIINREAVLKTSSSAMVEDNIKDELLELHESLPENPRRIKRIINMISLYQASAELHLSIRFGTNEWRQLVLWIVLMSEHPKAWRLMCEHPQLAKTIINRGNVETLQEDDAAKLLKERNLIELVQGGAFRKYGVNLDEFVIRKLRRLTPH